MSQSAGNYDNICIWLHLICFDYLQISYVLEVPGKCYYDLAKGLQEILHPYTKIIAYICKVLGEQTVMIPYFLHVIWFRNYNEHIWKRDMALIKHKGYMDKSWERDYMIDKLVRDRMRQEKWTAMKQQ